MKEATHRTIQVIKLNHSSTMMATFLRPRQLTCFVLVKPTKCPMLCYISDGDETVARETCHHKVGYPAIKRCLKGHSILMALKAGATTINMLLLTCSRKTDKGSNVMQYLYLVLLAMD